VEVLVPDLGDFTDVEIIEIAVKPGDTVEVESPLLTLETDKAAMDVPSPAAGKIAEVTVGVGDRVSEGDLIAILDTENEALASGREVAVEAAGAAPGGAATATVRVPRPDETEAATVRLAGPIAAALADVPVPPPAPPPPTPQAAPQAAPPRIDEAGFSLAHASPSIRKLARELGVDLARVTGSGRKNRVTADDVKAYVKRVMQSGAAAVAHEALPSVPDVDFARFGEIELRPLSRIQKISGPRLHASWLNVPHVTQHDSADITALDAKRHELKALAADGNVKLTPLAFIVRACAIALAEFPLLKSSLAGDGEHLVLKQYTHIGFAADTANGLVVPVIRDADRKGVFDLARELSELSAAARDGKLGAAQIQGGVFTISSLGGIGGTAFTPIINAPEVAILGVSRSRMEPVYREGGFIPRLMLPLSLSYDHRVIDGAEAVRFTTRLGAILGDVDLLLEADA
jgi:pyruvate dehydrogenase E2 component (dihydrolipoamide acetyltransferase)